MEIQKKIREARAFLKEQGFQTDNLWCIEDVKHNFKCTDDQAHEVLIEALTNEATVEQIHFSIRMIAEDMELDAKSCLFEIDGYWKDNKERFAGYIVKDTHDIDEDEDDDIFFYGLSEQDIQDAIDLGENTVHEFVISRYEVVS